jgi:SAM-dependent methyltransferase
VAGFEPDLTGWVYPILDNPLAHKNESLPAQRASGLSGYGEKVYGEELLERLEADAYDLVFARGWVDACHHPEQVIREMLRVVKPGGFVFMEHRLCPAGQYLDGGPHGWGFSVNRAGELDIRSQQGEIHVSRDLTAICQIECERVDSGEYWLTMSIHRRR